MFGNRIHIYIITLMMIAGQIVCHFIFLWFHLLRDFCFWSSLLSSPSIHRLYVDIGYVDCVWKEMCVGFYINSINQRCRYDRIHLWIETLTRTQKCNAHNVYNHVWSKDYLFIPTPFCYWFRCAAFSQSLENVVRLIVLSSTARRILRSAICTI